MAILEEAETIIDPNTSRCYRRDELLGRGTSGRVYKMTDVVSGKSFAVKIMPLSFWEPDAVYQEVRILKKLQHKNVVGFSHCFQDENYIYVFMELCSRQTLRDILKARGTLTDPEVRYYMRQLISGLKFIHRKGYVHRDIKLDNLFINDKMQLKIGDFGLATKLEPRDKEVCGTPAYMAPEIWNREGHGAEADIWALGCIMYELLVGHVPFNQEKYSDMVENIKGVNFTLAEDLPVAAGEVLSNILRENPRDRLTLPRILRQKFFTKGFTPKKLPASSCDALPQLKEAKRPLVEFFNKLAQRLFHRKISRVEPSGEGETHSNVQVAQPAESPIIEFDSRPLTKLTWSSWSEWLSDIQTGST